MKQVTRPDSTTVSYKYDALGRRVQRSRSAGGSTNYIYDGQDVIKDINSDNSTIEYLNGLGVDNKLRQASSAGTVYFSQDHLGSTRALTDTSGNVVESVSYDSFGNGSSTLSRYGYTGREWDADSNLYYYRNRWYDPQDGRFISEDPIGLQGGINSYAYVGNNPTGFIDPKGTQARSDRNWNEGERNPITGERMSNDFRQASGMWCHISNLWLTGEAGGVVHVPAIPGGTGAIGIMINPFTLQICIYVKVCARIGPGVYAGGGLKVGVMAGSMTEGPQMPEVAWDFPGLGGRAYGPNSAGFEIGPNIAKGAGSMGIDACVVKIIAGNCASSNKCPCS